MDDALSLAERIERLEDAVRNLTAITDALQVTALHLGVQRDLTVELFTRLGLTEYEGLPLADWWHKASQEHLQTLMFRIEDKDPGGAAFLQSLLNQRQGDTGAG